MRPSVQCDKSSGVDGDLLRIIDGLEMADGVFRPNAGSLALAECVRGLSGSFLDLGAGTGFISIVVSQSADSLLATDCSTPAVRCAERNFRRFGVNAEARVSDMFESVAETFDYIVFNPPVQTRETELDRRFKNGLKQLLPTTLTALVSAVARPVFKHSIRSVISRFYVEASRHLNPGGTIFVNTLSSDIQWLINLIAGGAQLTECRRSAQFCIVAIKPFLPATKGVEGKVSRRAGATCC
jgi:methylase of polypeptide subunit release factors